MSGKAFSPQAKEVIYNVFKYFETEKDQGFHTIPIEQLIKRCCTATGCSRNTLLRIVKEGRLFSDGATFTVKKKRLRPPVISCDELVIIGLRNFMMDMYCMKKGMPTMKSIFCVAKERFDFQGQDSSLRRILAKYLGCTFIKKKPDDILMVESSEITNARVNYLSRIRENDVLGVNGKQVMYINDILIHGHGPDVKCGITATLQYIKENPSTHWILLHAGGKLGYISSAQYLFRIRSDSTTYKEELTTDIFLSWLEESLIPNLPQGCLVVMNNTKYNSDKIYKPSMKATRETFMEWLEENKIPYDASMSKLKLHNLVREQSAYKIDYTLIRHGFEVLRLPPLNCDLNPTEYIGKIIQSKINENFVLLVEKGEAFLKDCIEEITLEDWAQGMEHVKVKEQEYRERQVKLNKVIESLKLKHDKTAKKPLEVSSMSCDEDE